MYSILVTIHIIVCISIIIVVLLQVGRGAELGAAFGSMGQANNLRGEATFVGKFTTVVAILFMVTSFLLTYTTANNAKTSVIDKVRVEETGPITPPLPAAKEPSNSPAAEKSTIPAEPLSNESSDNLPSANEKSAEERKE